MTEGNKSSQNKALKAISHPLSWFCGVRREEKEEDGSFSEAVDTSRSGIEETLRQSTDAVHAPRRRRISSMHSQAWDERPTASVLESSFGGYAKNGSVEDEGGASFRGKKN